MCRNVGCIHWDSAEYRHQHRMVALESTYDSGKCNSISISTNCKYIWWWYISKRSRTISSRTLWKSVGEAGNGDQQANWTLARGNREARVVHGCWSHQVTWDRVGRDQKGLIDLMSVFVRFGFIMVLESILCLMCVLSSDFLVGLFQAYEIWGLKKAQMQYFVMVFV